MSRTVRNLSPPSSVVKICICALIALVLGVWTSNVIALDNESPDSSKIIVLEKEWNEVYKRSDVARMDELLADDYIITIEDGGTFSKPGYIAHNGNSTVHVEISEMSELKVRMHGNTAVVTGAYYEKGIEAGKPYEYRDRLTDVWMKIQNRWKLVASHYSLRSQ
jgi:ketosteroid isomerase-like protein